MKTLHSRSHTSSKLSSDNLNSRDNLKPKDQAKVVSPLNQSAWKQLLAGKITCDQALTLLVNPDGVLNLDLLDVDVSFRFFNNFREETLPPPVIPLLLWQNCFYLASPAPLSAHDIQRLKELLRADITRVSINTQSYAIWYDTKGQQFELVDPEVLKTLQSAEESIALEALQAESIKSELIKPETFFEGTKQELAQATSQIDRIKALIRNAISCGASDIHLEPQPEGLRVRYRIDGTLRHILTLPYNISRRVIVSLKVMSNMDITISRVPQDGRITETVTNGSDTEELDVRVSTIPCTTRIAGQISEKAVLRILREQKFASIKDLGFSSKNQAIYESALHEPQGMILFCGPTGSGKTSTLYTSLSTLVDESINIVTVEDPVEYMLPDVTQTQVNEAAGMTFSVGLKALLRQDPDIIMLGEVRDGDTVETAIRAALTGHLVLTTLHSNDAAGAIPRLKDMGPDPSLISDALVGIVAQRLVRKVCPHCAQPYQPSEAELSNIGLLEEKLQLHNWIKGTGCDYCFHSGYLGREGIFELLMIDEPLRLIIQEGSMTELRHYLKSIRYNSFRLAALEKINAGITTLEEALRVLGHKLMST